MTWYYVTFERPPDLSDRVNEWNDLVHFARQPGRGIKLALVGGRRRQVESLLLRRVSGATGGVDHQALEHERSQTLDAFGGSAGAYLEVPERAWRSEVGSKPSEPWETSGAAATRPSW